MMLDAVQIGFRPLTAADLPLMHHWINDDPDVLRWWKEDAGPYEKLVAQYMPYITGQETTRGYIITYATESIGFIQEYMIRDYPEYAEVLQVDDGAAALDVLIGEAAYRDKGLGSTLLRTFVREFVFTQPQVTVCIIAPEPDNARAIRAYANAGFVYLKTVYDPQSDEYEYVMYLTREGSGQ